MKRFLFGSVVHVHTWFDKIWWPAQSTFWLYETLQSISLELTTILQWEHAYIVIFLWQMKNQEPREDVPPVNRGRHTAHRPEVCVIAGLTLCRAVKETHLWESGNLSLSWSANGDERPHQDACGNSHQTQWIMSGRMFREQPSGSLKSRVSPVIVPWVVLGDDLTACVNPFLF